MSEKTKKKDVIWGYVAQIFNIGAGLIVLPFILNFLPADLLGVWYIFLAISGFAMMLDFGFQPTFSRNVAYIFGGATRLIRQGIDHDAPVLDHPNYELLKNIIGTMKRLYGLISLGIVALLFTVGTWYIINRTSDLLDPGYSIVYAWIMYALSTVLSFYYSYYNCLLIGRGFMKEYNQLTIVTRSTFMILAVLGLILGFGLLAVAGANLLSVAVNRMLAVIMFNKKGLGEILRNTKKSDDSLLPVVWFNARKLGIGGIGSYFVQRGNVLFVSIFLPLPVVAAYGLTCQIMNVLSGVSPLYLNTHMPELYRLRVVDNKSEIRSIFGESVFVYTMLFAIGAMVVLFLGNPVLQLLHSKTLLIPFVPLLLMIIFQFLESNHSMAGAFITTRNEVPYVKAAIISGLCIAICSVLTLKFTSLGLMGVILSVGTVQLCYNNWKWPLVCSQELKASYPRLFLIGAKSLYAWFLRHAKISR